MSPIQMSLILVGGKDTATVPRTSQLSLPTSQTSISHVNRNFVNLLCPELLCEIFFFCLPAAFANGQEFNFDNDSYYNNSPTVSALEAPIVFSHVCQYWRYIALGHRMLWSSISLGQRSRGHASGDDDDYRWNPRLDMRALHVFAARSGDVPMRIFVDYGMAEEVVELEDQVLEDTTRVEINKMDVARREVRLLLETVWIYRDRILTLSMAMSDVLIDTALDSFEHIFFPRLQFLNVVGTSLPGEQSLANLSLLPSLREVTLIGVGIRPASPSHPNQLVKDGVDLTELRVTLVNSVHPRIIANSLATISHLDLSEVNLYFNSAGRSDDAPADVVHSMTTRRKSLPAIISLSIDDEHPDAKNAALFLEYARLSSLQCLYITGVRNQDLGTWRSLAFMLAMSRPPLTSLEVYGTSMSIDDVVDCLKLVSSTLEELIGDETLLTGSLMKALTWPSGTKKEDPRNALVASSDNFKLCPQLEDIIFVTCSSCPAADVTAMILSRAKIPSDKTSSIVRGIQRPRPLKELKFEGCSEDLRNIKNKLEVKKLVVKGELTVVVE